MPVQEQTPYIKYVANGVTQTFSTEFDCESKDQLVVMLNGEEPAFTSWSYADKQVTFVTAPVVDTVVELKRQSKLNRTTDYQSFNHTLNYKALNSDFDRIWYAIQEQNYKAGQYDYDYNVVLTQVRPIATGGTGANNVFNARSNLDVYSKSEVDSLVATGGEGNVVGVAGGGTGATTVAEARTNLGVMSSTEVENAINSATPQATEAALGVAKIATTAIAQAGTNDTDIITAKKLRDALSASGDAPVSACRAWVCFDGITGTIKNSFNISSMVKNGTGDYTINFSKLMPTSNYIYTTGLTATSTGNNTISLNAYGSYQSEPILKTTSQLRVMVSSSTAKVDAKDVNIGVFC